MRHRVAVNEGRIARGEIIAGVLKGGGECVPVNELRGDPSSRWQGSVKIVDFEISADGKGREPAADVAGKACPAVHPKRQIPRSVARCGHWDPLLLLLDVEVAATAAAHAPHLL